MFFLPRWYSRLQGSARSGSTTYLLGANRTTGSTYLWVQLCTLYIWISILSYHPNHWHLYASFTLVPYKVKVQQDFLVLSGTLHLLGDTFAPWTSSLENLKVILGEVRLKPRTALWEAQLLPLYYAASIIAQQCNLSRTNHNYLDFN